MRLRAGQLAPDFEVQDILGDPVALNDCVDKKLMLSFYRYASCPLCNLRVAGLIHYYPSFHKKGLNLVAFFESPSESILEHVTKQDIPFPIVADPERKTYELYGIETSLGGYIKGILRFKAFYQAARKGFRGGKAEGIKTLLPADFLLSPGLIIKRAYYGRDIGDHLPIKEIEQFLEEPSQ